MTRKYFAFCAKSYRERAGMIAYYMDGEKLGELPVVTAEAVEKAGYIDQLQKLFGKWAGFRNKAA